MATGGFIMPAGTLAAGTIAICAASCRHAMAVPCMALVRIQNRVTPTCCALPAPASFKGEVPDYLIGYFNYITSLGPLDVPDYEWLEMQLDSGATGLEPPRAPIRRQLADWPSTGETYSRKDYAMVSTCACTRDRCSAGDCRLWCAASIWPIRAQSWHLMPHTPAANLGMHGSFVQMPVMQDSSQQ